jgi:hypothetical protein
MTVPDNPHTLRPFDRDREIIQIGFLNHNAADQYISDVD